MGMSTTDIWKQHEAIMQAIADGDADEARTLAQQHIEVAGNMVISKLAEEVDDDKQIKKAV